MATPVQAIFGRDMLFNLASVFDWLVATAAKKRQVDIENVREKAKWITHEYTIIELFWSRDDGPSSR